MNKQNWPADKVERRSIGSIIPYARNSRTHSDEQVAQIAASINEWGFTNPILIDIDGEIIAGHGRLLAAQKLGLKDVPCITAVGWSDAQKKAYVIADNKLALNAGWDNDMLAVEFGELKELDFNLDLIGFDSDELASILKEPETEGLTDEDAVPDAPEVPVTVEGDVWLLGRHRLMCGDSTSIDAVEKLMNGQKADQWVTDPPYNVDYEGSDGQKIKNDAMENSDFRKFLIDAFSSAFAVMKPGGSFYIWHADLEGYNFRGAVIDCGERIRSCLIWNKPSIVMGRSDYHWKHEPCLYGWKDGASHLWATDRKQSTVIDFIAKPKHNNLHPTMKPVELIEYQIQNNTKGHDVVLDTFGGSGSTLIACEKTNRDCRMMELDPKYCDVIIKRWQEFTGKSAVNEQSEQTFAEMQESRGTGG
jgi:site-specific DNA-methyltransferase (adenine-specific)